MYSVQESVCGKERFWRIAPEFSARETEEAEEAEGSEELKD
jgi:hypothetical protein